MLLALIIALCGLWLALKGREHAEPNPTGANSRIFLMVVYCFLYALFFQVLGFIIATTAMTILVVRLFVGAWFKVVVGVAVMSIFYFLLLDRAIAVVLPVGLREHFL